MNNRSVVIVMKSTARKKTKSVFLSINNYWQRKRNWLAIPIEKMPFMGVANVVHYQFRDLEFFFINGLTVNFVMPFVCRCKLACFVS